MLLRRARIRVTKACNLTDQMNPFLIPKSCVIDIRRDDEQAFSVSVGSVPVATLLELRTISGVQLLLFTACERLRS